MSSASTISKFRIFTVVLFSAFYIFNFADTFITIGVFIYILDIVISKSKANGNKVS